MGWIKSLDCVAGYQVNTVLDQRTGDRIEDAQKKRNLMLQNGAINLGIRHHAEYFVNISPNHFQ